MQLGALTRLACEQSTHDAPVVVPPPRTASHAAQVVGLDVLAHLELVDDERGNGGRGAEDGAARDQDVHVLRLHACKVKRVWVEQGGKCVVLQGGGSGMEATRTDEVATYDYSACVVVGSLRHAAYTPHTDTRPLSPPANAFAPTPPHPTHRCAQTGP